LFADEDLPRLWRALGPDRRNAARCGDKALGRSWSSGYSVSGTFY